MLEDLDIKPARQLILLFFYENVVNPLFTDYAGALYSATTIYLGSISMKSHIDAYLKVWYWLK